MDAGALRDFAGLFGGRTTEDLRAPAEPGDLVDAPGEAGAVIASVFEAVFGPVCGARPDVGHADLRDGEAEYRQLARVVAGQREGFDRFASAFERPAALFEQDRKSTRLNSSHVHSSYAACCLEYTIAER